MSFSPAAAPVSTPPKWVSWLIALVPLFPPLYLVALGCLGQLRQLPLPARYVLFFFASTQLIAALFTPAPLLSLGLAVGRTLLIFAMIAAGVYLRESSNVRPLLWGQLAVFGTAWAYTLVAQGFGGVQARLGHPYYSVVSLGLVAVTALWLVMFWRGTRVWWRWPAGLLALMTFIAAGSRGPLLALGVGSLAALALGGRQRRWWVLLPAALVLGLAAASNSLQLPLQPLDRLLNDQTSGREYIWKDAVLGWQTSPLGGVGAYQGGPYLTFLFKDGCQLTPTLVRSGVTCPEEISRWSSVWLIAHNAWLHWLLETGLIGVAGLLGVMGYALWRATQIVDPFVLAVLLGFTAMNVVDVVIAVPSQHFAELWWVCVGISLSAGAPAGRLPQEALPGK
ncbi:O-antigen ligase family protein [Deinococcus sp. SDU3-2]|uniref:O-antigen ligase family protein n=1 Tax=Deinococcus terrestris TaxID=2651870 RepID=A0A7X1TSM9_9DEIO|nr:O-antigen ligase family protein [Deinococcus terrestris]MPY67614.1 O-antigen ligase family protein [Deinococcus terrestris]